MGFAHAERYGNQAPPAAHPLAIMRPLPGSPRSYPAVLPSPQRKGCLSGFANRSYTYNPSLVSALVQAGVVANRGGRAASQNACLELTDDRSLVTARAVPATHADAALILLSFLGLGRDHRQA